MSEELLKQEAPVILSKIAPFQDLLAKGSITECQFTASYLLLILSERFPRTWPGSLKKGEKISGVPWRDLPFEFEDRVRARLSVVDSVEEIFSSFALKSTPEAVNRAILEWSKGNYSLELMFRIPTPSEVLAQQKRGSRCVTCVVDKRIAKYILGERDSLSFTMHDLIHADHFYYHNQCYQGQLGFYGLLDRTLSYFDLSHEAFAAEFEYLISDMNAYAVHLLKCLKSAMLHYFSQDYFEGWLKDLNAPTALHDLNTGNYSPVTMDQEILRWLDQFRVREEPSA